MTDKTADQTPPEPAEAEPLDEKALNERLNEVYKNATPKERGEEN